ncbi:hypothetical protein RJT34_18020 [Clitoria ternatea]|uniref:TIR domain-containing protein n=1 Tax=Clitoria ternatea TaxID=43366 RepID=A0AAN9PE85_CLITE
MQQVYNSSPFQRGFCESSSSSSSTPTSTPSGSWSYHVYIVECNKKDQVSPILYGVDPSNLKHHAESFEEAFKKHEDRFGSDSDKVQRWRHALTQVTAYSGWDSNSVCEAKLVDNIAQHIHKRMIPKLPYYTRNLVAIASRVEEVNRFVARWSPEASSKTNQIKFLILNDMKLHFGLNHFPNSLKVLHWRRCSLKTLSLTNQVNELVDIELSHSEIKLLWHGKKFLEMLKYMDLSFSKNLKQLPDLSGVPNIEELELKGCTSLTKVHPSLLQLKKLVVLNFEDCTNLKTLPCKLEMSSLEELILTGCSEFKSLPGFGESMKDLSMLSLQGTAIRKLPASLGCLVGLGELNLRNCKLLVSLPNTFHKLSSLKVLYLSGCSKFRNLPEFGERMKDLSILEFDKTNIRKLPSSLGYLVNLLDLKLSKCRKLVCLPDTIDRLKSLEVLDIRGCSKLFESSNASLKVPVPLSWSVIWKFTNLPKKIGLPHSVLSLPYLIDLDLSYCNLFEESIPHDFCNLPLLLRSLHLGGNPFVSVPINISKLTKLEYLKLSKCQKLQQLPNLPSSIRKLFFTGNFQTKSVQSLRIIRTLSSKMDSFDMVITGSEIPAWFVHQEDGEHVSASHDCSTNDYVGIALCFLLISYAVDPSETVRFEVQCCLDSRRDICLKKRTLPYMKPCHPHLYVLFLDPSRCEIRSHSRFGLFQTAKPAIDCHFPNPLDLKRVSCGSRWLHKQDIELLNNGIHELQYSDSEASIEE